LALTLPALALTLPLPSCGWKTLYVKLTAELKRYCQALASKLDTAVRFGSVLPPVGPGLASTVTHSPRLQSPEFARALVEQYHEHYVVMDKVKDIFLYLVRCAVVGSGTRC
jgi:hypothetical protein